MYIVIAAIITILLILFFMNKYGSIEGSIIHWLAIYIMAKEKAENEGRIDSLDRKEFYKDVFKVRKGFNISELIERLENSGHEVNFRELLLQFICEERKISPNNYAQVDSIIEKINKKIPENF